jgi:hypothetical protein
VVDAAFAGNQGGMTFGCAGCGNRWGGQLTCHCSASGCHMTFSTPAAFAKHRFYGKCREPFSMGLMDAGREYRCFGLNEEE